MSLRRAGAMLLGASLCLVAAEAARIDTITVSGEDLSINGTTKVPSGLFGVHGLPLTETVATEWGIDSVRTINFSPTGTPLVANGMTAVTDAKGRSIWKGFPATTQVLVECLWDRYQPAIQLTRPDWKAYLSELGRSYGENAKANKTTTHLEFWNEPYLNWATRPGVNLLGYYYDQTGATPGGPMHLKTTGEIIPDLVWDRQVFVALKPGSLVLDQWASGAIPQDAKDGDTVKLRGVPGSITLIDGATVQIREPRILRKVWLGKDLTQTHYWSGVVNLRFYLEMYAPFAAAVKAANPDVQIAAGWGFNLFNDNWGCWEKLVRPTIDAVHPWLDAVHEHHYGGDTRMVTASYEVAYAYALSRYGKRLTFWNTEAGGHLDPEQPGVSKPANEGDPLLRATAAMTYLLRDVIHMLAFVPDKAYARAAHHPQENGGDEIAFRMLKPLRGRLVATNSTDARLWSVASRNEDRLCIAVFNDRKDGRRIRLQATPPTGQRFVAARRLSARPAMRMVTTPNGSAEERHLALADEPLPLPGAGDWSADLEIGGTAALVVVLDLEGTPASPTVQRWQQHVSPTILQSAEPAVSANAEIELSDAQRQSAQAARLRVVLSHSASKVICRVNGQPVSLPADSAWTIDIPVPLAVLRERNTIEILNRADHPITLASCSLWLRSP